MARRHAESTIGSYAKGAFADGQDPVSRYVDDVIVWGRLERVANDLIRFRDEKQLVSVVYWRPSSVIQQAVLPRLR